MLNHVLPFKKRFSNMQKARVSEAEMFRIYWANFEYIQTVPLDLSNGHLNDMEWQCLTCDSKFLSLERLKAHAKRHYVKDTKRYSCALCNKSFVQKSSLTTHIRIHTGEKPLGCDYCTACFGDASTHKKHIRTHTKEKPYKCRVCKKAFSQSGNCLRHERQIHKLQ